jgi:hypothetical protein
MSLVNRVSSVRLRSPRWGSKELFMAAEMIVLEDADHCFTYRNLSKVLTQARLERVKGTRQGKVF